MARRREGRLSRFAAWSTATAALVVAVPLWTLRTVPEAVRGTGVLGMDAALYFRQARSWLDGTGFYLPWQLAGQSYAVERGAVTYPPTALPLLAPFALGLPAILWWIVPGAMLAVALRRSRPSPWGWAVLALLLLYPRTWVVVALGNPSMWVVAGAALGVSLGWPAALALLKPTLAPLALLGAGRRSLWAAAGIMALVSLPMLPLWADYLRAMSTATTDRGAEYLLGEWPLALVPVVARAGRRRCFATPYTLDAS